MKKDIFEYFIFRLLEKIDGNARDEYVELSKLKVIKLHFFTVMASLFAKVENEVLSDYFNNFTAMPLGPVDGDVLNWINNDELKFFKISRKSTERNTDIDEFSFDNLSFTQKKIVQNAIESLLEYNNHIITYSAYDLVEITHKWSSWKLCFSLAREKDSYSQQIPFDLIKSDYPHFHI